MTVNKLKNSTKIMGLILVKNEEYWMEQVVENIIELSDTNYLENKTIKNPIVKKGDSPWNSFGMHHVDAHFINGKWVAAVDGRNN